MEAEENNTITVENKIHGGDKSSGAGTYVCDFSSPIVAGDISTMQNLAGRSYYDGKDSFYEKLNKSSGLSLVFNLRHTNLDLLLFYEEVIKSGGFNQYRYFLLNEKREKVEQELGVLRTNCIGCLDCTNVTQSMVGRKMLKFQLRRLGAFDDVETISAHPNLDQSFKLLWAIHGDDISIQYSGTPALKGNFVRCGHRTAQGVLADRCNALTRYYLNNFVDGTKQDAPLGISLCC